MKLFSSYTCFKKKGNYDQIKVETTIIRDTVFSRIRLQPVSILVIHLHQKKKQTHFRLIYYSLYSSTEKYRLLFKYFAD